jgi:2-oxoglutarate dehydrogenase E1 component
MSSSKNLEYEKTAFLSKSNSAFIEEMYMKFVNNDPIYLIAGKIF